MIWPFKKKIEKRSSNPGYTAQLIQARTAYITGTTGLAELTSTVQGAVSLWENGLSVADVGGTNLLTRRNLALIGRMLALRGEAVFYATDTALIPASDWDLTTRLSVPTAYRLSLPDEGGGRTVTALAGEVLHFRIGADANQPWFGTPPLRRASLSANLLQVIEEALVEVYRDAPLGTSIVAMPEMEETDLSTMGLNLRGNRGKVHAKESVNVSAAGGPAPQADWKAHSLSPDLSKALMDKTLDQARDQIALAFGILPAMFNRTTTGPMVREAQRHLAQWTLSPIAEMVAEEASEKLGGTVSLNIERPLQAFDQGGRARAAKALVDMMAAAKESGVDPAAALKTVDWATE